MRRPLFISAVLFLSIGLASGCARVLLSSPQKTQAGRAADDQKPRAVDMTELYRVLEKHEDDLQLFTTYPVPEPAKKNEEKVEHKKIEVPIKATIIPENPPTALQEAPGPSADDQLLDLWHRDIDQAMQQPPGRRQIQFSIPVVENDRVRYFISFFSGRLRDFFMRALSRSGRYIPMMAGILQEEGLPQDLVYLSLIESGFSPYAVSKAKAVGSWQFIRSTGARYGLKINGWLDERRDPVKATRAAAAYLKDLHLQFGQWFLAAAAYNAGERKVEKAMHRSQTGDFWSLSENKSHLKLETRNYVPKFIAAVLIASEPEKYGFGDVGYEPPMQYDEVQIQRPLRLETIAKLARTSVAAIKELNPALLRNMTPPQEQGYVLRLPAGTAEIFNQAYKLLPQAAPVKAVTHRVKNGETLGGIARRYGQKVSRLMELNGLKSHLIRAGQELIVVLEADAKKR